MKKTLFLILLSMYLFVGCRAGEKEAMTEVTTLSKLDEAEVNPADKVVGTTERN